MATNFAAVKSDSYGRLVGSFGFDAPRGAVISSPGSKMRKSISKFPEQKFLTK